MINIISIDTTKGGLDDQLVNVVHYRHCGHKTFEYQFSMGLVRVLFFSFLCNVLQFVVCPFVLFLLAMVLTVFLLFAASDCPLWYFQTVLVLMLERKIFNQNVISNKCSVLIGCFWVMRTKLFIESFMIARPVLKPNITDVVPRPDIHFGYKVSRHLHVYTYGRDARQFGIAVQYFPI